MQMYHFPYLKPVVGTKVKERERTRVIYEIDKIKYAPFCDIQ